MNKSLLLVACGIFWNVNAQEKYYYAPMINLANLNQPLENVGHDFGYVNSNKNNVPQGYYLWLDNQWYQITNAKSLFTSTDNGLAFYVNWEKREDLKIKDQLDVIYSYPIEAIDGYLSSRDQFDQLALVSIEEQPELILENAVVSSESFKEETVESPILDIIDIKEEVVREVIPFEVEKQQIVTDPISEITELKKNKSTEDSQNIPENAVQKEGIFTPAQPLDNEYANPYEIAVTNGFEGSVTEWIEMVTEKEGISPYEKALKEGYDRSETDYMRLLWGSKVNPEIDRKERDTKYVMDWIDKIKTSDGSTPYELALKHGFYGTFTEWVESVIGADGETLYNNDVKKGYKGTYRSWLESKLKLSNDELQRKEMLKKQNFVMVPNMTLSVSENPDEVSTFSLYNYYQMYYGSSVISSNSSSKSFEIKPEEIEYQITWFNKNEILIKSISGDGIIYYQKNPTYLGNTTNINVRYIIK